MEISKQYISMSRWSKNNVYGRLLLFRVKEYGEHGDVPHRFPFKEGFDALAAESAVRTHSKAPLGIASPI